MKIVQRVSAFVLVLSLLACAPALAFSLPSGFTFSDTAPTGAFKAVALWKRAIVFRSKWRCSPLPGCARHLLQAKATSTSDACIPWDGGVGPVEGDAVNTSM